MFSEVLGSLSPLSGEAFDKATKAKDDAGVAITRADNLAQTLQVEQEQADKTV